MRATVLLLAILSSGCASIGARDPLCPEIVRFANAVEPGRSAQVILCVDWGPRCGGGPESLFSKHCEHGGYEPASRFCKYLTEHSSAEFPANNFGSALACLGRGVYEPKRYGDYVWEIARVRTDAMPGLEEGVEVGIDYERGSATLPASLTIEVKADQPPFPHDIVMERLRREAGGTATIQTRTPCAAAARERPLTDPAFGANYPDGAWLICDATATREAATVTLFRYLFHASLKRTLVSNRIDVTLIRHGSRWRIAQWNNTAIDYTP